MELNRLEQAIGFSALLGELDEINVSTLTGEDAVEDLTKAFDEIIGNTPANQVGSTTVELVKHFTELFGIRCEWP